VGNYAVQTQTIAIVLARYAVRLRSQRRTTTRKMAAALESSRSLERRTPRLHTNFAHDRQRTATFLKQLATSNHERKKLFWSGDRLEWLLANGFHDWLVGEINAGRAAFPQ
jgi:hypothetical protein